MDQITRLSTENAVLRQSPAVKRPDRPTIEANSSDSDWALFLDTWGRYKRMTKVTARDDITMELRACCSTDVNKLMFDFVGPVVLDNASEAELLAHIKSVAVKGVHKEVHRLTFVKIRQSQNEPVTHFVARLKAQAALCDFTVECPSAGCQRVSYAEEMISHQLVAGLYSQEFQSRILSEAVTLTTLKLKVDRLQTLESTEESTQFMHPSNRTATEAAGAMKKSQYKTSNDQYKQQIDKDGRRPQSQPRNCNGCG